jgi:hypothetical protein
MKSIKSAVKSAAAKPAVKTSAAAVKTSTAAVETPATAMHLGVSGIGLAERGNAQQSGCERS